MTEHEQREVRYGRIDRVFDWVAPIVTGCAVAFALVTVYALFLRTDPYDPIEYTGGVQRVERVDADGLVVVPQVPGVTPPSVRTTEGYVPTRGTRCVDGTEPVEVVKTLVWERLDVPGTRVVAERDRPAIVPPGCEPLQRENPIPTQVTAIVQSEGQASTWQLVGSSTPVRPGGVRALWQSTTFVVVP